MKSKLGLLLLFSCNVVAYIPEDEENVDEGSENFEQKLSDRQIEEEQRLMQERRNLFLKSLGIDQPEHEKRSLQSSPLSNYSGEDFSDNSENDRKETTSLEFKTQKNLEPLSFEKLQQNMVHSFELNLMNFDDDAQAVEAVEKFLESSNPSSIAANSSNAKGETLLSLLLDVMSPTSIDLTLKVTQLLLDHGAKISSADVEQALKVYNNFVINHNLEEPKTFLGKIINQWTLDEAQKQQKIEDGKIAKKMAQIVFMLDDVGINVVTPVQNILIKEMREKY